MKQTDLAETLGVTQTYISKYLKGYRGCSLQTAKKLSELFGKDPLWWMESTPDQRQKILNGSKSKRDNGTA